MFNLILILLFFSHRIKESSVSFCPRRGWNRLFVVTEEQDCTIYINSQPTGLTSSGPIWLSPEVRGVDLKVHCDGCAPFVRHIEIHGPKLYVVADLHKPILKVVP